MTTYHILSKLQVLSKVHAMFDRVVSIALHHHICNRLAGPCIPSDELSDDIEKAEIVLSVKAGRIWISRRGTHIL